MFAVIKTGGKQYLVKEGETIQIETLAIEVGKPVSFETLLVASEDASNLNLGLPSLGELVTGEVVSHGRTTKVDVVKYKPKVRYQKRSTHRQNFTKVKILKIK